MICPRGHPVQRLRNGVAHCHECRHSWQRQFLIPIEGRVGKPQYQIYARAFRAGYVAGRKRTVELAALAPNEAA